MAANVSYGGPRVNSQVKERQMCMKANNMSQGHSLGARNTATIKKT